ncbi:secreted protein, partial [Candidatus Thiomargarita nelsonii]
MCIKTGCTWLLCFICGLSLSTKAGELSGYIGGELRYFPESPQSADQYEDFNFSLFAQPEYRHEWDNGNQIFTFAEEILANIEKFKGEFVAQNVSLTEEALFDGAPAFDEDS